jgi:hypothetical protein
MLHLLGLKPPADQHGRVLTEALRGGPPPGDVAVERETLSASRADARQCVRFSAVDGHRYLDYGWAEPSGGRLQV